MDVFFKDYDSCYSESSSFDDHEYDDDDELMYGGQASCILSNLEQTIGKIDDFLTFERDYVHGDIVCSLADPSGQMGRVISVEKVVDLENGNGIKLKNISSKKLKRVFSISVGDYVVMGHWLGKAERIVDRVIVMFDDGTKGEFTAMDDVMPVPLSQDSFHDSQFSYFPGQRVKLNVTSCFSWFCGTKEHKHNEGTVSAINVGFVHVKWLGCSPFGSETTTVPEAFQRSEHLTVLTCFPHSNWQIGDWCLVPGFQEIFVISKTKIKVDVLWQDGSKSHSLHSGSVCPVNIIDPHDFWPNQFVLEKGTHDDQENKKWGVVKIVDASEKTVKVKWEGNGIEEIVSAYELIEHTKFLYCYGDVVFGLEKSCPVGIVIGFKDGRVEVKWAAGFTSKVAPDEIFRIDESEGLLDTPMTHVNVDPNLEKSEHDVHLTDPNPKDDVYENKKDCFNVSQAATSFLSDVAARFFTSRVYTILSHFSKDDSQEESMVPEETNTVLKIKENDEYKDVKVSSSSNMTLQKVENFEMVNDCSMHYYIDRAGKDSICNQVKRNWLKKVQQEWDILMKNLPETIYVRVFEERMDLLRVAIVGAPGTPYHDGLFFFDIFLPPEYPQEPPMLHYISGGLRMNPNLYESGRVCLSLLNTWTGSGSETWDPKGSTILQVVLSLQALVLNKNPYFNEAGYDQQAGSVEGEKNSCSYNEHVFLMNCKSILFALHNPPQHFEALAEEHFRKRCTYILMACKAYKEGIPIGCAFRDEHIDPEGQTKVSTGFKITLSKLYTKLLETFGNKGFDCGEYA